MLLALVISLVLNIILFGAMKSAKRDADYYLGAAVRASSLTQ